MLKSRKMLIVIIICTRLKNGYTFHEMIFLLSFIYPGHDCSQLVCLHERCRRKESDLPPHSFVNLNMSPTTCTSLIFHLCCTYQSIVLIFISFPYLLWPSNGSSLSFISATVDLSDGGGESCELV